MGTSCGLADLPFLSSACCTISYMTKREPTDPAAQELALWQVALNEQRAAERQLDVARRGRKPRSIYPLHAKVEALRNRADMLLAKAVETKLLFADSE